MLKFLQKKCLPKTESIIMEEGNALDRVIKKIRQKENSFITLTLPKKKR